MLHFPFSLNKFGIYSRKCLENINTPHSTHAICIYLYEDTVNVFQLHTKNVKYIVCVCGNANVENDRHQIDTRHVNWPFDWGCREIISEWVNSIPLEYVVFQLDDDILFMLNENCTVFHLMKLFKIIATREHHSIRFCQVSLSFSVACVLSFISCWFIHSLGCSFVRLFVCSSIAFTFQIEAVRHTN